MTGSPRIAPGGRAETGALNRGIARIAGVAMGSGPPNVMTTLGRHRRLFRRWLPFAGALMPGGTLPRRDTELLILRVSDNTGCAYERHHHERLGRAAGLSPEEIARVPAGHGAGGWSPRERALLRAADELHETRDISDGLWAELRTHLGEKELIEVCMLVGHYEMLAMTLNALRVQPDRMRSEPTLPMRLLRRLERRRAGRGAA